MPTTITWTCPKGNSQQMKSINVRASALLPLLVAIGLGCSSQICAADPLKTAEQLAAKDFSGWTYGSDPAKREINCVQFIARVLEVEIKRPLTSDERNAVLIAPAPDDLEKAILEHALVTRGIQHAIVDLLKKGANRSP